MDFSGPPAERLADAIEAMASRDLYAAAPPELRNRVEDVGGATLLVAPTLPVTYFNRVIGLGNRAAASAGDIEAIRRTYTAASIASHWVHVIPSAQPSTLGSWLEQAGYSMPPRRSWAKFLRDVDSPPSVRTEFLLREAVPADARPVADVITIAYGMPPIIGPWFAALVGRAGWRVWVAESEGRIVATGSIFIQGDRGWLGVGATLAEFRGHGAQSALLAARIRAANEHGCRVIGTETGEPVDAEPNPSLDNIVRAGFVKVCSRLNYSSS